MLLQVDERTMNVAKRAALYVYTRMPHVDRSVIDRDDLYNIALYAMLRAGKANFIIGKYAGIDAIRGVLKYGTKSVSEFLRVSTETPLCNKLGTLGDTLVDEDLTLPEEKLFNSEKTRTLVMAINSISHKYREIILLHYFNKFTLVDIAKSKGLDISKVSSLHRKAIKELKKQYMSCWRI